MFEEIHFGQPPPRAQKLNWAKQIQNQHQIFFLYKNTHSDGRKYHMQYRSDLIRIGQD